MMAKEILYVVFAVSFSLFSLGTAIKSLLLFKESHKRSLSAIHMEGVLLRESLKKESIHRDSSGRMLKRYKPPPKADSRKIAIACGLVVLVFGLSVAVVWSLTKIGGPLGASVDTSIKKLGGNLVVAGTGAFAVFFAVALMAFGAIYIFGFRR